MKSIKQQTRTPDTRISTRAEDTRDFSAHMGIAASVVLLVFGFMCGYFWGIKSGVEQLSLQLDQEAFADQISASLIPMHDAQPDEGFSLEASADANTAESVSSSDDQEYVSQQSYLRTYYAQLAGFGSKRAAQRFAQKLEKQDIPVIINAVHSKNSRGKSVTWYQIVTESYSTKEELEALVERLKETEKLKDPQIVHC